MPKTSLHSGRAFDAGLAALAAVSAGFVVFAMPEPVFAGLIQASRLPDLIAAADPPLGETARFAVVGVAALLTFAAVWALMAALGRVPARRAEVDEPEAEAPRLRRADAHPDAPARRPLLARDLGEPLELDQLAEEPFEEPPFAEADRRPLPGFLIPQTDEPEPVAETEAAEAAPEAEPEPMPLAELAAQLPEPDEEGEETEADQPLSQLVNRIEFGLSRKRQALPAADLPAVEEPSVEQEKVGHRLRSAINDLQKIASSGA
jgi:hypothetical protein